jgi:hypothetical protein
MGNGKISIMSQAQVNVKLFKAKYMLSLYQRGNCCPNLRRPMMDGRRGRGDDVLAAFCSSFPAVGFLFEADYAWTNAVAAAGCYP